MFAILKKKERKPEEISPAPKDMETLSSNVSVDECEENISDEEVIEPESEEDETSSQEEMSQDDDVSEEDSSNMTQSDEPLMQPHFPLKDKFEKWKEGKDLSDDLIKTVETAVEMIEEGMKSPDIDESVFDILLKGVNYEEALAQAAEAGELKGRNTRISELMAESSDSDGVPHPGTGCGSFNPNRRPSIFELARNAF